jgi:hypothetical protein
MLIVAISLSAIAAFYSIMGLAAIFAAAVVPIIIMGSILEVAKVTVTVWLHEYWQDAKLLMRGYLTLAVVVLMMLTSMGIFGFLSKAHSDQSLVSGDSQAKIAIYDEKIKTSKDNIETNRRALQQMDAAVDQIMGRSTDEKGADKAVATRRAQQKERNRLLAEISAEQKTITRLNEEAAPLRAENRKIEAEVGPIKYIAALIYGDNPDQNILERAVRWVIIMIVVVFDPLAIMMLLAATESISWIKREKQQQPILLVEPTSLDSSNLVKENEPVQEETPPELASGVTHFVDPGEHPKDFDEALVNIETAEQTNTEQEFWDKAKFSARAIDIMDEQDRAEKANSIIAEIEPDQDQIEEESLVVDEKQAQREWKDSNPGKTLKQERARFERGEIKELPWQQFLKAQADNSPVTGEVRGFGIEFPENPLKGDQFIRVDVMPNKLYKYNGTKWIEIDKNLSDQYTFDTAYVDHLINKLDSGEYDAELLSDAEREQIKIRLTDKG